MAEELKEEIVEPAKSEWYVVHTYSGYENKVLTDITNTRDNNPKFAGRILDVKVPVQETVEIKDGKPKTISRKLFPGYVFIQMVMDDEVWYVIRNTRGVTGFVGPGSKAVPLTEAEIKAMGISEKKISVDFEEGDLVEVINGSCAGSKAVVRKLDMNKEMVTIEVDMFGGATPLEVSIRDVRKA